MEQSRGIRRSVLALALVALVGCGDDDEGVSDDDAPGLIEQVLAGLELPGEREPPIDPAEIPEGELEFGFHCQIQSAGFDVDDVLVAFPHPAVGHDESGGTIERVEASILAFDTAETASAVLAAYDVEDTVDCLDRTFGEPIEIEPDDPLETDGVTAEGFALTIGTGGIQREGHRTFAAVVGRMLVDITVLAADEDRGRELAEATLGDVVEGLRAGGA
jgi:hypothetical protein